MEYKTMKPECNIDGTIIFYDLSTNKRESLYENETQVYLGYGIIHSLKGRFQEIPRYMHFYKKI